MGYSVNGTIREPASPKNAHLMKLDGSQNLKLFKADLLNEASLKSPINGCNGVFHLACMVPPIMSPIQFPITSSTAYNRQEMEALQCGELVMYLTLVIMLKWNVLCMYHLQLLFLSLKKVTTA